MTMDYELDTSIWKQLVSIVGLVRGGGSLGGEANRILSVQ